MHKTLSQLAFLHFAAPTTCNGLSIQPILDPRSSTVDWLSLDEALENGASVVTEISEGGSVPELFFDNRGPKPVLLLDGEELVGAKQNRVLNASVLIAANSRTRIPVSCVEQGRWSWRSRHFATSDRVLYSSARKGKLAQVSESLACNGTFVADQCEIWSDIEHKSERMGVHSHTRAAADLYEQRATELSEMVAAFQPVESQVGAAFFVDGQLAGLDLIGCPRLFARVFPKLVRSYALDRFDRQLWVKAANGAPDAGANPQASGLSPDFLAYLAALAGTARPSVGIGEDIRIADPTVIGAALVVEERIAQLSVFPAGVAA